MLYTKVARYREGHAVTQTFLCRWRHRGDFKVVPSFFNEMLCSFHRSAIVGIETTSANYRWRSSKVIKDGRTIIMYYFFWVMDQRGSKNLIVARSRPVFLCKWIVLKYCLCSTNTRRVATNVNIAAVCKISVNDC